MGKTLSTQREIIETHATFIVSREHSPAAHGDPQRSGGYVRLRPGRTPEIVLDGLATPAEQHLALVRCQRELEETLLRAQTMANADLNLEEERGQVLVATPHVVVVRRSDPEAHGDPRRRGGYVLREAGKVPTIILDGMAPEAEQARAEQRLRDQLQRDHTVHRLRDQLSQQAGSVRAAVAPKPSRRTAAGSAASPPARAPAAAGARQVLLGERLIQARLIDHEELAAALALQAALPGDAPVRRLGSLLVEAGVLALDRLGPALGEQRWVQAAPGHLQRIDPPLRGLFPAALLQEVQAAPLYLLGRTVVVAMCDPHRRDLIELLQEATALTVRPMIAPQFQVARMLGSVSGTVTRK